MTKMLAGKVCVVTGAGNGIGRSVAIGLALAGARVVVNDLGVSVDGTSPSNKAADSVVEQIRGEGGVAVPSYDSVATMQGGRAIIQKAIDEFGALDSLTCVAGILRPASIFDMTEQEWDTVVETNLKGHFTTVQPAAQQMRKQQKGSITLFTSSGGLEGSPGQCNYSATKAGIVGLMRSIALALAPYATCNAIAPQALTRMIERMPRAGYSPPSPDSIAPITTFLASDHATHITGQLIRVKGSTVSLYPQPRAVRTIEKTEGWTPESLAEKWEVLGADRLVRWERYHTEASANN
jgi:NAD(P)-dependent dehydrogenase (short-subunit alcohol dehydrogenase family)